MNSGMNFPNFPMFAKGVIVSYPFFFEFDRTGLSVLVLHVACTVEHSHNNNTAYPCHISHTYTFNRGEISDMNET